jgi:nickel/cobalt transporter (NicO) family protein
MLRFLILLSTWFSLSWGCLACSYGDIKLLTHLYLNVEKNTLQSLDVEWTLDPMFSQLIIGDFDLNRNGKFENGERDEVYKAIEQMKEMGFFIRPTLNNRKIRLKELKNFTVRQEKGLVIYRFTIPMNTAIGQSLHLRIAYDADAAFNNGLIYHLSEKNVFLSPSKSARLTATLTKPKVSKGSDSVLDISLRPATIALASPLGGNTQNRGDQSGFSENLRTLSEKIHGALVEAQENPSVASIGVILLFSLLYGVLHAAGPGHGKALVASYFSTNERSYGRGISIALLIAATHVISAFVITMILYWFVHTMFSQTIQDVSLYATKASGVIILLIVLYLARQKWLYYRPKSRVMSFTATAPHLSSCGCHSCKTASNSTDLMLILGAGIVPCPGTIVVFLFTLSMGMVALGVASAVTMSLGMGFTIALTAALGTALREKSGAYGKKALKITDILGLTVMFLAAMLLLMGG